MHTPPLFVGVRRAVILGVAMTLAMALPAPSAFSADDPLADAQAKITAAQEAADTAGAEFDEGQAHYYQLQDDVRVTRTSVASLRASRKSLAATVRQRAAVLYMRTGLSGLDEVFDTSSDVLDTSRRATLGAAANADAEVSIGQLRAATEDLNAREASLRFQLTEAKTALDDLRSQRQDLERAVEAATRAEQQLRVRLERERRIDEYATLVREAQDAARTRSAQLTESVRQAPRSDEGASSDSPSTDEGPTEIIGSGSWVCPVQGGMSFTDTYGAPRSGGRTHKGVDMFAARGTPTVAVIAGSVFFQGDTLGGLAAYVQGNDGNTYYYAHLDDYVGGGRSVSAGELIGHVGNTGASDAPPHLHFEIRLGGPNGTQINPYPTVRANC